MPENTEASLASFETTHLTLLERVRDGDPAVRRPALEEFLRRYLPALRAHLVIRRRLPPDQAEEMLQNFVTAKVLEGEVVGRFDHNRGVRFRVWLRRVLDNYLIDRLRRARPGREVSLEGLEQPLPDEAADEPSAAFDGAWAREVLAEAIRRMQGECAAGGRADVWGLFTARILAPILEGAEAVPYERLVAEHGFRSPKEAMNALVTAKRAFRRALESVIAEYAKGADEISAEIDDLRRCLAHG